MDKIGVEVGIAPIDLTGAKFPWAQPVDIAVDNVILASKTLSRDEILELAIKSRSKIIDTLIGVGQSTCSVVGFRTALADGGDVPLARDLFWLKSQAKPFIMK